MGSTPQKRRMIHSPNLKLVWGINPIAGRPFRDEPSFYVIHARPISGCADGKNSGRIPIFLEKPCHLSSRKNFQSS